MSFLSKLFGAKSTPDFKSLHKNGAMILDVRTTGEFSGGHIRGSVNIPMNKLAGELSKVPKGKAIICVCASGVRSASAKRLLQSSGYTEVYNGGGWRSLQSRLNA